MAYGFAQKLMDLRNRKTISKNEYDNLMAKLSNHEIAIRNNAIDEFEEKIMTHCSMSEMNRTMINQIAEQIKYNEH